MYYSYEEPREEAHCISVWGSDLGKIIGPRSGGEPPELSDTVQDWLAEHDDLVIGYIRGGCDPDEERYSAPVDWGYTFRFKTKDAATLFKLAFG